MNPTAPVVIKAAWLSKINWTQALAMLAAVLVLFGIDLDAHTQAQILVVITAIQGLITWWLKTFGTPSVTPTAAQKT